MTSAHDALYVMATNPARRVPLGAWQEQFIRWMEEPEEDAVLAAATSFDFRQLYGELDAEAPLRRFAGQAAGNRRFLGRLAVAALWRRPPLGFLHHLRGDHHGRVDLKAHGPTTRRCTPSSALRSPPVGGSTATCT